MARLREAGVGIEVGQPDDELGVDRDVLEAGVRAASGLVCLLTESVDRAMLEGAPRLLGVANMAVGYNNIDVAAATELGIPVSNTPGVLTETSADLAFALLLATARRLPQAEAYLRGGRFRIWGPNAFLGADVGPGAAGARKTLGVVGFGRIGRAMARRATGFDMRVLATGREAPPADLPAGVEWVALDELLRSSDFVSLHVPLTEQTHHLIGAAELAAMRPTAILINTSRGPVVDEAALVEALRAGDIAAAGLDVYEAEPELADGLLACENAVLLPHIASASHDTRNAMALMAVDNVLAHLDGRRAANVVNPRVYDSAAWRGRRAAAGGPG